MSDPAWFVKNVADGPWIGTDDFGAANVFEGDAKFQQIGINVRVLQPGQPNGLYHAETMQEDFLVLHGECLLLIDEREVPLKAWDFVHCPPGTNHIFIGAGNSPCAILMVGARGPEQKVHYPISDVAQRYNASTETETDDPKTAYANRAGWQSMDIAWPL